MPRILLPWSLGAAICVPACFSPNAADLETDGGSGDSDMGTGGTAVTEGSASGTSASGTTGGTSEGTTVTSSGETATTTTDPTTGDPELCGNGDVDDGEECDLGVGNSDSAACTEACRIAVCGDGLLNVTDEDCDDAGESETCDADCTPAECGDGTINATAGETCDGDDIENGACTECNATCADGFDSCDEALGCEVDVTSDPEHCGNCTTTCDADQVCLDSGCQTIKRVFLSSDVIAADFGGTDGADTVCQALADAASLGGEWMAWVSSNDEGISVTDRFTQHDGPYVLMDGTIIATGWADLIDGTLLAPIMLTELNGPPGGFGGGNCHGGATCTQTFTGTNAGGGSYTGQHDDCDGWTTTTFLPAFAGGDATATDQGWSLAAAGLRCDYAARIYCFEQ